MNRKIAHRTSKIENHITGGQVLVEALVSEGVDTVFGIPGTHSLYVYDALLDAPEIRHILVRHEQGAAFMADGYARSTGKVGVCLTTTGPATLNTFGALATSYGDSCPVLLLCTELAREYIGKGKGIFHEVPDQLGMLERVTGFCARANSGEELVGLLREAIFRARSGRPRPTALELPADVLKEPVEGTVSSRRRPARPEPDPRQLQRAIELIVNARRPIIWAGGGVISSGAHEELARLAEVLGAPVLTTNLGKGALPADHPLHLGYLVGQPPVREYLTGCDLLLAVGTRFTYLATDRWTLRLPEQIVHCDIDPEVIDKNYRASVGVVGDARAILEALLAECERRPGPSEDRAHEVASLKEDVRAIWSRQIPLEYQLIQDIRSAMPRETIVAGDPTVCSYLAWQMLDMYEPRSYLYPMGCATLGYSLPAALGAKVAHPDRPVVAICGDGGFLFTCQELGTAVQYGIPVVTLVFNDNGYGLLRTQQDDLFGRRNAVDLGDTDFVALAEAFGADALRLEDVCQLEGALRAALEKEKPTVIEIPVVLSVKGILPTRL